MTFLLPYKLLDFVVVAVKIILTFPVCVLISTNARGSKPTTFYNIFTPSQFSPSF